MPAFSLAAYAQVERLITTSTLANTLTGNGLVNLLGGGLGNDIYNVGAGDIISEASTGGTADTANYTGANGTTYTLGNFVEKLNLVSTNTTNGTGNTGANIIVGSTLANNLKGMDGNDTLTGGLGNDTLTGGNQNDIFVFNTAPNSTTNRDVITDLNEFGNDFLRLENTGAGLFAGLTTLGTLAAASYTENLTGLATAPGQRIIYEIDTGKLWYDSNGSTAGGTRFHFATLDANKAALYSNADFVVI